MKNLKKVLAMVLAFACTFTMFASAKMYEDVQPGTEFSEAITMLSDLGIIQGKTDNKYHPEDTITRAEACALIARLMTGDPNAAGFNGAHHFKDVPAGHWASSAIGYAVVNGIAVGVDQAGTRFEPNRPIKDKEFVTMIVRALGYETPDMRNNFPFGYMSAANAIGLLQDVNMVPDTDALRGEDAQVIYNAMFVDYARGAKRVNVAHGTTVETYPTLAEDVWHLNRAALGTWNKKDNEDVTLSNCKAHTWVILGEAQDEENAVLALAIDDNDETKLYEAKDAKTQQKYKAYKFKYEGTADIDALRGYKVELWGAGKHGEPVWEKDGEKFVYSTDWKIKAIKTVKNQTKFDYNPSMADRKSKDGSIELNEETKLSLGSAADNAQLVKQEQGVKEVVTFAADVLNTIKVKNDESLEEALNVRNGMQYKLIDWNNDKEIDWVVVDEARYYKVESASSKRVVVTSMEGDNLKSDKNSVTETWKVDSTEKIGKNLAGKDVKIKYEVPEGLKEGDIVELTFKVAYDGAQVITATAKLVDSENMKLDKVATRDGLTLTFGDKELKVAQNARKDGGDVIVPVNPDRYAGFNGEELGAEFALTLNRNGFIVHSDYATEAANYMMVLNTASGKDVTGDRDLAVIDFVDANNKEHKDVKISSSVRVLDANGETLGDHVTGEAAYKNRTFNESMVVGNVFKYWTDADGVITKMQGVFGKDDVNTAEDYEYKADADRLVDTSTGANNKYVASLEDAKIIFAVKGGYIRTDSEAGTGVRGTNLVVRAEDVLATKQQDIPDINTAAGNTHAAHMLDGNLPIGSESWLGNGTNKDKYIVELNRNSAANAAILGVDSFNKFNAGQTKLALVTNVSENSAGVIEAEVAYNGETTTLASVEKQDFEDIVKVFDGTEDNDIARADSVINTKHGNGVFDGGKLSNLVNEGGQYAEVTTDKDGKLTKVVFMDGEHSFVTAGTNDNLLTGHYYTVSRNLVREVKDKNLRYHLNNNKTYGDVTAAQKYAGADDKLQSVIRLPSESAGYADDAKFYQIDGAPTRHDKRYDGTRLTVNAGFNDIENRDIKVIEKLDVAASEPNFDSKKNVYEVADLAFNADGDLVAVYSFKSDMDEDADYKYEAPVNQYKIKAAEFAGRVKGTGKYVKTKSELYTQTGSNDKFAVYVGGEVVKTRAVETGVVGLTKDNFKVSFGINNNTQPKVEDVIAIKDQPGFYVLDLDMAVDINRGVTVEVIANGNAVEVVSGGVKVEDARPELGENNVPSGEDTPAPEVPGAPVGVDVVTVTNSQKTVVIKIVDDKGLAVQVNNITVPSGSFVANPDGTYTLTSSASLSGVTIIVDGKPMTLPTLGSDSGKVISAKGADYKLMTGTKDRKDVTGEITRTYIPEDAAVEIVEANITTDTGVTVEELDLNVTAGTKKVSAKTAVLNKLNAGDVITFKIQAAGVKSNEIKVKINQAANITASKTEFDANKSTLTLILDKDYTGSSVEAELKALTNTEWEKSIKDSAANNFYTKGVVQVKGVNIQKGKANTEIVLQLDVLKGTLNTAATLTSTNVMDTITLKSGTTVSPNANTTMKRAEITVTVTTDNAKNKVIVDFADEEVAKKIFADSTTTNVGSIFVVKTGADKGTVTTNSTITSVAIGTKPTTIELTMTDLNGGSDDQRHCKVEIKTTQYYAGTTSDVVEIK